MIESDGKLDRSRSFGVVYGDPNIGFMQDNKPYRHDGAPYSPTSPIATVKPDEIVGAPKVEDFPTVDSAAHRLTHSQKMKQIWAERRAAEAKDANTTP